jgi:hypothetical protein
MSESAQFPSGWKVLKIEALPERKGVEITFGKDGHDAMRLRTSQFAVGRRGPRSVALAKFAYCSGYGDDVEDLYGYICSHPSNMVGDIFPGGSLSLLPKPVAASASMKRLRIRIED